ncbi:hypothetical protein BC628DRAFT_733960 [Trametes gibbosa]|nr:hypothetical protein BC628DRAFT_733960 [Trametes gibbosa]
MRDHDVPVVCPDVHSCTSTLASNSAGFPCLETLSLCDRAEPDSGGVMMGAARRACDRAASPARDMARAWTAARPGCGHTISYQCSRCGARCVSSLSPDIDTPRTGRRHLLAAIHPGALPTPRRTHAPPRQSANHAACCTTGPAPACVCGRSPWSDGSVSAYQS